MPGSFAIPNTMADHAIPQSAEMNANFAHIVSELNSFGTNGGFINVNLVLNESIADHSIPFDKLVDSITFASAPYVTAGLSPTHTLHAVTRGYVKAKRSATANRSGDTPVLTTDSTTAKRYHVYSLGNGIVLEFGYIPAGTTGSHRIGVDLTAGFSSMYGVFGTLHPSAGAGGNSSTSSLSFPTLSSSTVFEAEFYTGYYSMGYDFKRMFYNGLTYVAMGRV